MEGKRQRGASLKAAEAMKEPVAPLHMPKEKASKPPPPKLFGRACRLRSGPNDWVSGKLLGCSSNNKLLCEIELDDSEEAIAGKRTTTKVNLATQALHVLEEVAWGFEDGEAGVSVGAGPGRGDESKGEAIGSYLDDLVPIFIFMPLGPQEREAEDGHLLAQALTTGAHMWIRRESTRPLYAHMLRRRTTEKLKKAVDDALAADIALTKAASAASKSSKNKKDAVGKRLAVYWPMDDAWYTGVITLWDAKAGKHQVLYDDGVTEDLDLGAEATRVFQHEDEERMCVASVEDRSLPPPVCGRPSAQWRSPMVPRFSRACILRTSLPPQPCLLMLALAAPPPVQSAQVPELFDARQVLLLRSSGLPVARRRRRHATR